MNHQHKTNNPIYRIVGHSLHIDLPLLGLLGLMFLLGLAVLYSASNENIAMMNRQAMRLSFAICVMLVFALIPPHRYRLWTPWIYFSTLGLLIAVMIMGKIGKGAQRWLDLGFFRFQPSEIMKLAVPMMVALYMDSKSHPLKGKTILIACLIFLVPTALIVKQPDLGTGIMVASSGAAVLFLSGLSLRIVFSVIASGIVSLPIIWHFLHDYQRQRVLTLLYPENDPLGTGYHIIQSKIAIGSGGVVGKGWLNGSQSHLNFLPEHATDFIFAVCGEEFGFLGCALLVLLIIAITMRCFYIAMKAQTAFTRLLAGSLAFTYFLSAFVNIGMVMGILPVVGIPLPLVSYGGTALVTFMAGFGIMMSISTHKILFNHRL